MNNFQIHKAQKSKVKMRVALVGPSGSGKTMGALLVASGLADYEKILVIDSENKSADFYSDLGPYNVITLLKPYTPERYIEAIKTAEDSGMEVIIIDSMTHEWDGPGGCLDIHSSLPGNSFANWGKVTPRHNAFIYAILNSKCHIIATLRTKQDYVLQDKNGKMVPEKVGLKAITREGIDYEFTVVLDIDIKHNAKASKDRTRIFMDKPEFLLDKEHGKSLIAWANSGYEEPKITAAQTKKIMSLGKASGKTAAEIRDLVASILKFKTFAEITEAKAQEFINAAEEKAKAKADAKASKDSNKTEETRKEGDK